MSRYGIKLATEYGNKLLSFSNQEEAEKTLLGLKDECLARISSLAGNSTMFTPDFTPDSLIQMEKWFFELYGTNSFDKIGTSQPEFETSMAMYFGEVTVKNNKAKWVVEKYFLGKDKYTIGIRRSELFSQTLASFSGLPLRRNTKRRESIFREYQQYYGD
jgi:hypothetical protein